jgi:uncharacterized membrane-anchored protein
MAHHGPQQSAHHEISSEISMITKKIKKKPTCSLLTIRAQLLIDADRQEEAIHDLEHALQLDKHFAPAKSLLRKIQ